MIDVSEKFHDTLQCSMKAVECKFDHVMSEQVRQVTGDGEQKVVEHSKSEYSSPCTFLHHDWVVNSKKWIPRNSQIALTHYKLKLKHSRSIEMWKTNFSHQLASFMSYKHKQRRG